MGKRLEAFSKCKRLREVLAVPEGVEPLDVKGLERLLHNAEAVRFTRYIMEKFLLPPDKIKGSDLRELVVKEMKALRSKVGREYPGVPRHVLKKCHTVLWDN